MSYTIQNILSSKPLNSNVGFNNSWLQVINNANREFYAQASYVTNFDDLSISLSAADLNIGAVHISDPDNDQLKANVASVGPGVGALRVLSQDLEADVDTVSLGDINKSNVGVVSALSSLKVYITNPYIISTTSTTSVISSHYIANNLEAVNSYFTIDDNLIAVVALSFLPNTTGQAIITEYVFSTLSDSGIGGGGELPGITYLWIKNPVLTGPQPIWTAVGNLRKGVFSDSRSGTTTTTSNTTHIVHGGIFTTTNIDNDKALEVFPLTNNGSATPDTYVLFARCMNLSTDLKFYYGLNVRQIA
jgi:hypothetical protein